jgi:predicted transcriptional regulator
MIPMETTSVERTRSPSVTVKLGDARRSRIAELATYKKRSPHYVMVDAIDKYLEAEERERAVLDKVDAAIAHYDTTGLHVTLDEFKTWADARKLDRHAPMPACHA